MVRQNRNVTQSTNLPLAPPIPVGSVIVTNVPELCPSAIAMTMAPDGQHMMPRPKLNIKILFLVVTLTIFSLAACLSIIRLSLAPALLQTESRHSFRSPDVVDREPGNNATGRIFMGEKSREYTGTLVLAGSVATGRMGPPTPPPAPASAPTPPPASAPAPTPPPASAPAPPLKSAASK